MTITQSSIPGKDATDVAFTLNVGAAASGNKIQQVVVTDPATELLVAVATETGNLSTIANAQGVGGSGITPPSGASGILGWLSGIFNKLNTSVAVTGTFWPATQPVSASALPLPSGAATSANQTSMVSALNAIDAGTPAALGQTTMAASMPVTIASNQTAVPSSQSGTWNVGVTGTLPAFAAIPTFKVDQTTPGSTNGVASVGSSNWVASQVSVGTTATLLKAARAGRNAVVVTNAGTTAVYLGGSGVTASTGALLAGVVGATKVIPTSVAVYGIVASGTQTVTVEELY